MSVEAVAWALNVAEVRDPAEVLVLIGIANHVDRAGRGSFAGQATLAHYARCSDRTVRRKLAALEERGLIRRGDQRAAAHIPANVRPVVWDLVLPGQNDRAGQNGRADAAGWPDTGDTMPGHSSVRHARSRMSDKPLEEPLEEPSDSLTSEPAGFADFYAAYPRHEKPREARKAWDKAVTRADPETIIAGAARYAADPNRDPGFTAHPASWLNGDRWEDDPLPARSGTRDRQGNILAAELEAARAADAGRASGRLALEGGPW